MAQEVICATYITRDLRVTTFPIPILGRGGPLSSYHLYLPVNLGLRPTAFLTGTLARLRPLYAFGLANYNNYYRIVGDCVGEWVGWGIGNKNLPVCQVSPEY